MGWDISRLVAAALASAFVAPAPAPATILGSSFLCVIWFGWTSNRSASAASVWSPLAAASATFALKAAEWLRRRRFLLSAPARNRTPLLQRLHLAGCPKVRRHS